MAKFVKLHLHPLGTPVHVAVAHVSAVSAEVRNSGATGEDGKPVYAGTGVTIVAIGPGEDNAYRVREPVDEVVALLQGDRHRA